MNTVLWCGVETGSNTLNVITQELLCQQQKFLYENITYLFYIIIELSTGYWSKVRSGENVIIVSYKYIWVNYKII